MLAANGQQAAHLAERLRSEMERMFHQCQSGDCPSKEELDSYLTLQRFGPGQNFGQMALSRKFGSPGGRGQQPGQQGEGQAGDSGYAMVDGSSPEVMGNESRSSHEGQTARQSSRLGKGAGRAAAETRDQAGPPDTLQNLHPVNRQSGAVSSETVIEEYNDVVENYFKAITTKKHPPADEKNK
jgi:hypothetical protein